MIGEPIHIGDWCTLIQGDSLEVVPTILAESVDAIVTDAPYGLGFMGKDWDRGVPGVPFWVAALGVAKPGAHLLAFGGTRTFHRLAVAIEDAGWELRDTIMWVYASGFPKSLNFGCKCRGSAVPYTHEKGTQETPEHDMRPMREGDVPTPFNDAEEQGEVLHTLMSKQGVPEHGAEGSEPETCGEEQSGVEGRSDVLAEARQLQADQVRPMPESVSADGSQGRLYHGAPASDGEVDGTAVEQDGSGTSPQPRPTGQPTEQPRIIPRQQDSQTGRGVCPKCGGLTEWQGWGTALKPAWEPIIVARKPLAGTVAANVQRYGTGALNIDGCRVAVDPATDDMLRTVERGKRESQTWEQGSGFKNESNHLTGVPPSGRWPANLIHDGSEVVLAGFPNTEGGHTHTPNARGRGGIACDGHGGQSDVDEQWHNAGSAARFFYCAKASRQDREEGLIEMEPRLFGTSNGAAAAARGEDYDNGDGGVNQTRLRRNTHPTVKPTALMRYLVRLVTPPGGLVLDMFMGSGSTGKACALEGLKFLGIEGTAKDSAENIEIARRRIAFAAAQGRLC